MKKKTLSLALALAMCLGLTVPAFAAPEQKTVRARNEDELLAALKSNTTIILEDKTYMTGLWMEELENVTIQGAGSTRLVIDDGDDLVVSLEDCKNITLSGLVIGHDLGPGGGCTFGVINSWSSSLTILNCDIFGCGLTGMDTYESSVTMRDSTIRDCSEQIMTLSNGQYVFQNCTFSGNGYSLDSSNDWAGVYVTDDGGSTTAAFNNCAFTNNRMGKFLDVEERDGGKASYTLNNCTFRGNSWTEPADTPAASQQAMPTNDSLTCNGAVQTPTVYKIGDSNYFKIRDLAAILNGTGKQFSVGYDSEKQSVTATTGQGYTKLAGDLAGAPTGGQKKAEVSNDAIYINGKKVEAEVYKIDGSNYFKLRDLGKALDFYVGWSREQGVYIETDKPYK